jgi:hypothetical protein
MRKVFELTADVMVIVVGIVVLAAVGRTYWKQSAPTEPVARGTKLPVVSGVNLTDASQTLLLFLRTDCHFCETSLPFYGRLEATAKTRGETKLVALFPDGNSNHETFLRAAGLNMSYNRSIDFARYGVNGTPTLILVDRNGVVRKSWAGKLPAEREREVLEMTTAAGAKR